MKLSKIDITYFRCFESLSILLQPDINVFVGVNGAGKTAILDAIAIALWDIVAANYKGTQRDRNLQNVVLRPSDIYETASKDDKITKKPEFVQIRASANNYYPISELFNSKQEIEWQEYIQFRPPSSFDYDTRKSNRLQSIYDYFESLWNEISTSGPEALIPLPVVAYYRSQRHLKEMPELGDVFKTKLDRQQAFQGALNAGASYEAMCRWFYLRENQELREKVQLHENMDFVMPDLRAARLAVSNTIDNIEKIFFEGTPPKLKIALRANNGPRQIFELEQLSDGYRNLFAIVLDFSRRLAQANPNFENPLEAPGILLIDEIELHLHPKWQQIVIPRLHKIFPNTQLIVTTHSPQVLTTVEKKNIFILKDLKLFSPSVGTYGSESNWMLEEVFKTDARPPDNKNAKKIMDLFHFINSGDLKKADTLLKELFGIFGRTEPSLVEAETIIRNKEWEKELDL